MVNMTAWNMKWWHTRYRMRLTWLSILISSSLTTKEHCPLSISQRITQAISLKMTFIHGFLTAMRNLRITTKNTVHSQFRTAISCTARISVLVQDLAFTALRTAQVRLLKNLKKILCPLRICFWTVAHSTLLSCSSLQKKELLSSLFIRQEII